MLEILTNPKWWILRKAVFERDRYTCQYCGSDQNLTVDHIWPKSKGGKDSMSNLVTACTACNRSKGGRTLREWVSRPSTTVTLTATRETPDQVSTDLPPGLPPRRLSEFITQILDGSNISQRFWVGGGKLFTRSQYDQAIEVLMRLEILEWKNQENHNIGSRLTRNGVTRLKDLQAQLLAGAVTRIEEI